MTASDAAADVVEAEVIVRADIVVVMLARARKEVLRESSRRRSVGALVVDVVHRLLRLKMSYRLEDICQTVRSKEPYLSLYGLSERHAMQLT